MKAAFVSVATITILGALVLGAGLMAQSTAPGGMVKSIEGKVLVMDPLRKVLTLEDGTKLMIPESVKLNRADLKPGTMVKAAYQERDGQKILTHVEVFK